MPHVDFKDGRDSIHAAAVQVEGPWLVVHTEEDLQTNLYWGGDIEQVSGYKPESWKLTRDE